MCDKKQTLKQTKKAKSIAAKSIEIKSKGYYGWQIGYVSVSAFQIPMPYCSKDDWS